MDAAYSAVHHDYSVSAEDVSLLPPPALDERGHRRLTLSPRRIISGQIDAARNTQMAALAKINPYKTTMAGLLFINGLQIRKIIRSCRNPAASVERSALRGEVSRSQLKQLPIPIIPQAPHV
jgi:hypothetical protein